MNRWAHQQRGMVGTCVPNGVVCPKPRRMTTVPLQCREPFRFNNSQGDSYDSKVGTELLDMIFTKVSTSPPFFTGSPPNRASNPVIRDEHFCDEYGSPLTPNLESPASMNGGSVRVNFQSNRAPVRIEGFNCRRNGSIYVKT